MIFHKITPFLCFLILTLQADPLMVKLQPPQLDEQALSVPVSCDRPRRKEGVNISLEATADKLVVHCYGHGGFGFTTLFGSEQEAYTKLKEKNPEKHTPIRIIGSGCMGLALAARLHHEGFSNITISAKEKYSIPSWRAGGFFDPGTGEETAPEDQHHLQLGLATYQVLHAIEQGQHPYLTKDIVRPLPIYYPTDINVGVEVLEKLALVPPSELVTIDFGNGVVHEHYKRQWTYFIGVTELMTQLWDYIKKAQIPVIEEEVRSLDSCAEPIVCNCTGLGARQLNNDAKVYPARGHFFMLPAQAEDKPLNYMLFTKVLQEDKKVPVYFFPKQRMVTCPGSPEKYSGMLGGTFVVPSEHEDVLSEDRDATEFAKLKQRAQLFFYGHHEKVQA